MHHQKQNFGKSYGRVSHLLIENNISDLFIETRWLYTELELMLSTNREIQGVPTTPYGIFERYLSKKSHYTTQLQPIQEKLKSAEDEISEILKSPVSQESGTRLFHLVSDIQKLIFGLIPVESKGCLYFLKKYSRLIPKSLKEMVYIQSSRKGWKNLSESDPQIVYIPFD